MYIYITSNAKLELRTQYLFSYNVLNDICHTYIIHVYAALNTGGCISKLEVNHLIIIMFVQLTLFSYCTACQLFGVFGANL